MRTATIIGCLFLSAIILMGCGPIKSILVIQDAEKELKAAEEQEAADKVASVYYYYAAQQYLYKAKDEHGHSDFMESERFAQKALDLAQKANAKAAKGRTRVYDPEEDQSEKKSKKTRSGKKKKSGSDSMFRED